MVGNAARKLAHPIISIFFDGIPTAPNQQEQSK